MFVARVNETTVNVDHIRADQEAYANGICADIVYNSITALCKRTSVVVIAEQKSICEY